MFSTKPAYFETVIKRESDFFIDTIGKKGIFIYYTVFDAKLFPIHKHEGNKETRVYIKCFGLMDFLFFFSSCLQLVCLFKNQKFKTTSFRRRLKGKQIAR